MSSLLFNVLKVMKGLKRDLKLIQDSVSVVDQIVLDSLVRCRPGSTVERDIIQQAYFILFISPHTLQKQYASGRKKNSTESGEEASGLID